MSKYKTMLHEAKRKGLTNESKMWESVADIEPMLEIMEAEHPEEYKRFMHKQHKHLYGAHYNPELADEAVAELRYTDRNGQHQEGGHWTKAQILEATKNRSFPTGVTDCDKYVAFNAMYADLCKSFDDSQIIEATYLFYFNDEDWHDKATKVFDYMSANK